MRSRRWSPSDQVFAGVLPSFLALVLLLCIPAAAGAADQSKLVRRAIGNAVIDRAAGPTPTLPDPYPGPFGVNADFVAGRRAAPVFYMQRIGARWVQIGLARRVPSLRAAGWSAFRWGFTLQRTDGSFDDSPGSVLGVAFLVEAAGWAHLAERAAGQRSTETLPISDLVRSARWLARRDPVRDDGVKYFRRFVHRNWVMAAALSLTGDLTGTRRLRSAANRYANRGFALQRRSGVNPEAGGYDVGYQATGLISASRFYLTCRAGKTRATTRRMIRRGARWLASRVRSDGSIAAGSSTRVGVETGLDGETKRVPPEQVAAALGWAALVTKDRRLERVGTKVLDANDKALGRQT